MPKSLRVIAMVSMPVCLFVMFTMGAPLAGQTAAPGTLTLSIKGSPAFATPKQVQVPNALLVVTAAWEDVEAKTEVGGQEASGQLLFLSDLVVVLGNRPMDCTNVFSIPAPAADDDFVLALGKAEAYLPAKGWQTTAVGKVFMEDTANAAATTLALDRFSVESQSMPKKRVSRDNLRGNDGRLTLQQTAGAWQADFMVRSGDIAAEGKFPLTACPIVTRQKAQHTPLLGERRLLDAGRNYR